MKTVQFEGGRDAAAGAESPGNARVPVVHFHDQSSTGADSLHLSFESPATLSVYREFLRTVYAVTGGYPFQVPRPDWIDVERGQNTDRYDRTHSLVASATDDSIAVAVVDYVDEPSDVVPVEWRPDAFLTTVTVSVEEYVEQTVGAAEAYVSRAIGDGERSPDESVLRLLDGAQSVREAVREAGDLGAFRLAPDSPTVQSSLYDSSVTDPAISFFLVRRGTVREEIERLRAREDGVGEKYRTLLSHDSRRVQKAVAEGLAEKPDERAKEWLLGRRWTERPDVVVPALRAAAQVGGEDVRDALCETLELSSHAEIRETAAELLGDYPDGEAIEVLESLADGDGDEAVRAAARESLSQIRY